MMPSKRARDPAAPLLKMRSSSRIRKESKQVRGLATPLLQWRPISKIMKECKHKHKRKHKRDKRKVLVGYKVRLTKEEEKSWADFKTYDKNKHELADLDFPGTNIAFPGRTFTEKQLIDNGRPMVLFFAKFAVDTFNEICSKFGVNRGLRLIKILMAQYRIAFWEYVIYMDLLVLENGKILKYQAKVVAHYVNGSKTLVRFALPFQCWVTESAANEAELGHDAKVPEDCGLEESRQNPGVYSYIIPLEEFDRWHFPF